MNETLAFLVRHGVTILFIWVLIEQLGLPIPSEPLLLAAGALASTGRFHLSAVIGLPVLASLASDLIWYQFGRRRGTAVLKWICRISLEPDSCVRDTEEVFARYGARSLLFAKFVPGLSTAVPPLAGVFHMPLLRFIFFDALGASFWAASFVGLGFVFSDGLEKIATSAMRLGLLLFVFSIAGLAGYILWKSVQRWRFRRDLRIARISPEDLKHKLNSGESIVIVDLRHPLDFEADPRMLPGAIRMAPDEVARQIQEIPRDRDVVLYCTCPNEATSARVALLLRRGGILRVRPLAGGFSGWVGRDYPTDSRARIVETSSRLSSVRNKIAPT